MTDPTPPLSLAQRADRLTATVGDLADAVESLGARARRTNRIIICTITCLVLTIGLVVVVGALYLGQRHTTEQLRATTEQLRATTARVEAHQQQITQQQSQVENTRRRVLCPLYLVFLSSKDPERRAELSPAQQQKYDEAFVVIADGANQLQCRT